MDPNWINISAGVITVITGIITIVNAFKPKAKDKSNMSESKPTKALKTTTARPQSRVATPSAPVLGVTEFSGDDTGYQDWVTQHPQGYVVNTYQNANKNQSQYASLHTATCRHISNFEGKNSGAFTSGEYMKVCATDISALENWAKAHGRSDGSFTGKCNCSL